MRRASSALGIALLATACVASPPVVGPSDASVADVATPIDAPLVDAPLVDAPGPSPDAALMPRPSWLPPLVRACGAWVADVDSPTTYDTRNELAVALAEAECRFGVRCDAELAGIACDPLGVLPGRYAPGYRIEDAERCLRAWDAAPCPGLDVDHDLRAVACAPLFGGVRDDGAACTAATECAHACQNPTAGTCTGTCVLHLPWACEATGCASGDLCVEEGCATPVGEGAVCDALHRCGDRTYCDLGLGLCRHHPREGEPCYRFDGPVTVIFCGDALLCDEDMVCRTRRDVGLGDHCGGASICTGEGLYCSLADQRCHAPGDEGAECDYWGSMSSPLPRCVAGLYCAHDETRSHVGHCSVPLPPGEACDDPRACGDGTACLTVDLNGREPGARCAHLAGPGCACGPAALCPRDFECHEGACQRRGTFPHACRVDDDCIPYSGTCEAGFCEPHLIGDACTELHFCYEGRCSETGAGAPPGECRALHDEGEPCRSVHDCAPYATCRSGRCVGPDRVPYCPPP